MSDWQEYIEQLLLYESSFDGISLSFGEDQNNIGVPPIIKTSILMLDRVNQHQEQCNIIVFPERVQSISFFTLMLLLHNLAQGKVERTYDPSDFQPGEKLKLGNAVVEFLGLEKRNGAQCIKIKMADLDFYSAPIHFLPLLQRTNTKRRLSKHAQFVLAKKNVESRIAHLSPDEQQLAILSSYKTHMNSSIFNMTSIISAKERIANCRLCGNRINDILLIGQVDYSGAIRNVGAGQLTGIPSIVLAPDMYAILAASESSHPVQSIIIDASDSNKILNQMDALDDLMRLNVPITCVTDIVNSFDLQPFEMRGFNIWRWDAKSITSKLYDVTSLPLDRKIRNCAKQKVEYLMANGQEISEIIRKLPSRRLSNELSIQMMRMFEGLSSLTFTALRETVPFGSSDIERNGLLLDDALQTLASEKPFIAPDIYKDYKDIVCCLRRIYSPEYQLPKHTVLSEYLQAKNHKEICVVVPNKSDKEHVETYWQIWCQEKSLQTEIHVLHPEEYYSISSTAFSATVIVGWLNREIMKKILYSFNTQRYVVLLYDPEGRWKNHAAAKWNLTLKSNGNKTIISKYFDDGKFRISPEYFAEDSGPEIEDTPDIDELNEIELILRENRFRKYFTNDDRSTEVTAEAIPVNFVGQFMAFYRTGHKVISATKVITDDAEKIDMILPDKLRVGDFVVVREADRDLIKEMADILLANSGKHGLRGMATKWKEALKIEQTSSTHEEIYQKLVGAGCTKGYPTVRSWLMDEDVIAPQVKQDLQYIAAITGNKEIDESLDQIFDAAQEVRSAHVQAGRVLSAQLRKRIVEALSSYGNIDSSDIWEPIEMTVEGIGPVKVLKVIDVDSPIVVDIVNTNRLIEE